jgi:hypothetical protein
MTTTPTDHFRAALRAAVLEPIPATSGGCLDALVSIFPNAYGKAPSGNRRLAEVLGDIRDERYAGPVAAIRATYSHVLQETGEFGQAKKAIAAMKKQLPAFCMSGTAAGRTEQGKHSGFLQIDLDGLGETLSAVREKVKQDPYVAFGYVSPSGDGLKVGLRIDGDRHAGSFAEAQAYFKNRYGLPIDQACKDRLRLCFVSHDCDLWTNPAAVVFAVESSPAETISPHKKTPIRLHPASASCILRPASCITAEEVLGRIKAQAEAMASLNGKNPGLPRLYESLIARRYEAVAGGRNGFIVQAIPFLHRAAAPAVALELVGAFYDCHRAIFNDPRDQNMREAEAMIASVANTYFAELTPGERKIYSELSEQAKDAFRICRDLALLPESQRPPLTFFISYENLAARLDVFPMQAQRIMRQLAAYGLLKQLAKGTRRGKGVRGEAGTYQWMLPCESTIL